MKCGHESSNSQSVFVTDRQQAKSELPLATTPAEKYIVKKYRIITRNMLFVLFDGD
jgi:hypothetical protein